LLSALQQVEVGLHLVSGEEGAASPTGPLRQRERSEPLVLGAAAHGYRSVWRWGLIGTLLKHDLIDEFRLWIFPLVIGTGKRLFGDGTIPAGLKLADSKLSTTGVTITTYERAGDIDHGSFAFDEPTDAEVERRRRLTDG
jgi:hypothetical protein